MLQTWPIIILLLLALLLILATLRILFLARQEVPPPSRPQNGKIHVLIVLGSGGHTAEMLAMLRDLDPRRYARRTWVVSAGDALSVVKAKAFEDTLARRSVGGDMANSIGAREAISNSNDAHTNNSNKDTARGAYTIHTVPRARQIHQSLLTTPFSSLSCFLSCTRLLLSFPRGHGRPDIVLTNGPATALIFILAVWTVTFSTFAIRKSSQRCKVVYVESWARVRTPSLTLRIVKWMDRMGVRMADRILVQHRGLQDKGWGEWRGDLMY